MGRLLRGIRPCRLQPPVRGLRLPPGSTWLPRAAMPQISIFAGFPARIVSTAGALPGERTFVVRVDRPDPAGTLERVRAVLALAH